MDWILFQFRFCFTKQLKVIKFKCKVILHNSMEEKFMFRKNYHIFIMLL